VKVVFITEKFTRLAHECWGTNKIMGINADGTIRCYRTCTFGKRMETITLHLDDAVFPADLAARRVGRRLSGGSARAAAGGLPRQGAAAARGLAGLWAPRLGPGPGRRRARRLRSATR
jgi:hypothetical protein